eukprot:140361-Hanusia_phi.AAC.5
MIDHSDLPFMREREIASLHERLEVREKTIEDQNRREASLRRQIAEVTCLKLEFEAKSDEQTKSIHSISLENLKLKEQAPVYYSKSASLTLDAQLASLNDNLWGMYTFCITEHHTNERIALFTGNFVGCESCSDKMIRYSALHVV